MPGLTFTSHPIELQICIFTAWDPCLVGLGGQSSRSTYWKVTQKFWGVGPLGGAFPRIPRGLLWAACLRNADIEERAPHN